MNIKAPVIYTCPVTSSAYQHHLKRDITNSVCYIACDANRVQTQEKSAARH